MNRLLCLGDSITDCGRLFFQPPLGNGYVQMLSEKLASLGKNWQITNCGVDGFTLSRLLENVDQRYLPLQPDIITILIGINDVALMMNTRRTASQQTEMLRTFLQNYEKLLQLLQAPGRCLVLMKPFIFPFPAEFQTWQPHVEAMSEGIAALAERFRLPCLSLQPLFDQSAQKYGLDFVTTDGVHLTMEGQKILTEALYSILCQL